MKMKTSMPRIADLSGMVFGDLTAISRSVHKGKSKWLCVCVCGVQKTVYATHLLRGNSKTCSSGGTHGLGIRTPGYSSWQNMITRCTQPSHMHYANYGGRGITVCARWRESFANFYADMGDRPDGHSLDRVDTNGNYEPGNCRWATHKQQQNNMRSNVLVEHEGRAMTIAQFADATGIPYATVYDRYARGASLYGCR